MPTQSIRGGFLSDKRIFKSAWRRRVTVVVAVTSLVLPISALAATSRASADPATPLELQIIAGNGGSGAPIPGPALSSPLSGALSVAVDNSSNEYFSDGDYNVVEKMNSAGTVSVFAGNGQQGTPTPGPATSSPMFGPVGVAVDNNIDSTNDPNSGDVFIAVEESSEVLKVTPSGHLTIFAGNGFLGMSLRGPLPRPLWAFQPAWP